jgi:Lon protease-like protein
VDFVIALSMLWVVVVPMGDDDDDDVDERTSEDAKMTMRRSSDAHRPPKVGAFSLPRGANATVTNRVIPCSSLHQMQAPGLLTSPLSGLALG